MRSVVRSITARFQSPLSPRERALRNIHREWNRELRKAVSLGDAAIVDVVFTRALDDLAA